MGDKDKQSKVETLVFQFPNGKIELSVDATVNAIAFTNSVMKLLQENGFTVSSPKEALACINAMIQVQNMNEVHASMRPGNTNKRAS